ncbi:MAG: acyltransferase family protein [Lachnospiraceae bacterium]|nr:acyltransferase family protein [Lachnospiraceae bacterium]
MNKRLTYFDIAKGIGMVLVLIGHLQGEILGFSPYILYLCIWIFSFHMPFFFVVSGMLIRYKNDVDKDFKLLAKRRFTGIMIPYYLFSVVYIGIVLWGMFVDHIVPPSTLFVNLWYVVGLYGMNVLWFLPAAFLGELLFLYIMKKYESGGRKAALVIAALTIAAYILNLLLQKGTYDTALAERFHELCITILRPVFACSFIGIGYYGFGLLQRFAHQAANYSTEAKTKTVTEVTNTATRLEGDKEEITDGKHWMFPWKEFLFSFVFLIIDIACIYISMHLLHYNNVGEFRSLVHNNVIVYYVAAISGSAWLILFSKALTELWPRYRFPLLTFYGANSLVFMAVHNNSKVLTFALRSAMYLNQYLTRARGYICYGVIVLIMLTYTTLATWLISRYLPVMSGKRKKL